MNLPFIFTSLLNDYLKIQKTNSFKRSLSQLIFQFRFKQMTIPYKVVNPVLIKLKTVITRMTLAYKM